jgi:hypothetical protein
MRSALASPANGIVLAIAAAPTQDSAIESGDALAREDLYGTWKVAATEVDGASSGLLVFIAPAFWFERKRGNSFGLPGIVAPVTRPADPTKVARNPPGLSPCPPTTIYNLYSYRKVSGRVDWEKLMSSEQSSDGNDKIN